MYVCLCNQVTDSQILEAAAQGADTLEALSQQLNVATCCGRCAECTHQLLSDHARQRASQDALRAA
jgi:bacterioferritin-associated ferredoxin